MLDSSSERMPPSPAAPRTRHRDRAPFVAAALGATSRARWKIACRSRSPRDWLSCEAQARQRGEVVRRQHGNDEDDQRRHAGDLATLDAHRAQLTARLQLHSTVFRLSAVAPPALSFMRFSLLCSVLRLMPRISAARVLLWRV